jgi:polyhydroxyalkanoate synthase
VVSPPGTPKRSYQMSTHTHDAPYIAPDRWQAANEQHEGSWWPAWEGWLASRAGPLTAPPGPVESLGDAPGTYVLQP